MIWEWCSPAGGRLYPQQALIRIELRNSLTRSKNIRHIRGGGLREAPPF